MAKLQFLSYIPNQTVLFPQRIDADIAGNDPVRVVDAVVEHLDLGGIYKLYKPDGRHPYHPKMMLKVILYAYMCNIYSCRRIEKLLLRDIHFIWLAGYNKPDFITINRFRNRVKDEINNVFTQLVLLLSKKGLVSLDASYIDGTKIESKANKYSFVWKKTVEKNREKLMGKIETLLKQIDEAIAQDNSAVEETADITPETLGEIIGELNDALAEEKEKKEAAKKPGRKSQPKEEEKANEDAAKSKRKELRRQIKELEKHKAKLEEYDTHLEKLGDRNSYSKTDESATFMRMKEDAMMNGQTKPGYNLQIATESQFITDFGLFPNPTDTLTLIPLLESHAERYGRPAGEVTADSGYGSEENYRHMDESGTDAYVKYNYFHKEHRPRYQPNPFHGDNFFYNESEDYLVCPMGQHMERIGTKHGKTESGYITESARYQAANCEGCPLRCLCYKAKGNRRIVERNHRLQEYKRKAAELLTSEEGIKRRGQRCIEPEAVFGQIKANMGYKRFRHFGKDKVTMDFAFLAIAFNIKKMCAKAA